MPSRVVRVGECHLCPRSTHSMIFGTEAVTLWTEFRRSRRHGAWPVRPVTLRRHLSMACLFKIASRVDRSVFRASPNLPAIRAFKLLLLASCRRQEIYRVHNRYGLYAFLRAEIDRLNAVHYLSDEIRESMSVDCSWHIDTEPSGSIVRRSTIPPCNVGLMRSVRL